MIGEAFPAVEDSYVKLIIRQENNKENALHIQALYIYNLIREKEVFLVLFQLAPLVRSNLFLI